MEANSKTGFFKIENGLIQDTKNQLEIKAEKIQQTEHFVLRVRKCCSQRKDNKKNRRENKKTKHCNCNGCFLLEEKDASPEKLVEMVKKIILDKKKHTKLEKISHSYYKGEAAGKIYHSIIKYFENKNEILS